MGNITHTQKQPHIWTKARSPLQGFEKLGGDAAISAAVDRFYVKALADERVQLIF